MEQIPEIVQNKISTNTFESQKVLVAATRANNADIFGFKHDWQDDDLLEWNTEIVGCHEGNSFLVGINVRCQTSNVGVPLRHPKKPYIIRQILEELEGDVDGHFQVSDTPHLLEEQEVEIAARILNGKYSHILPVVYVSAKQNNTSAIDPIELSRMLGGTAHVVVEPSRIFSFALATNVNWSNPYDGVVAIYWPTGEIKPSVFFPNHFSSPRKLASAIANEIRIAHTGSRPDKRITWEHLRETIFRIRVDRLREEKNSSVEEYIQAFDEELDETKARNFALTEENNRLKREISSQNNYSGRGLLVPPNEYELFPGELIDVLVLAIKRAKANSQPGGRVGDVLDALIESNTDSGESARIEMEIKNAVKKCDKKIGKRERKALEDIGFEISEDGKHYKLVFRGDDRYTFAMPKTFSDWRAMKNWVSDTTKRLFK